MKFFYFFLFFIFYSLAFISASGFSPSSLFFNLDVGEVGCHKIYLSSNSETITVRDKWAENKSVEWKASLFNKNSSYHNLLFNYSSLLKNITEFKVCILGNKTGEYHGAILMKEEREGDTIIEMGVWLKVVIEEKQTIKKTETGRGGGSGGGGGGGGGVNTNQINDSNNYEIIELGSNKSSNFNEEKEKEKDSKITGSNIKEIDNGGDFRIIILIIIIIIILPIFYKKIWKK